MPARPSKTTTATKTDSKSATKTTKKETKPVEAAPVETTAAAPAETVENTATVNPVAVLEQEFAAGLESLTKLSLELSKIKATWRSYHSHAVREIRNATKAKARRNRPKTGDRPASGFVKPTLISNELASFLKVPAGTEMSRTDVTKALHAYIQEHKLKNKDNGRIIEADAPLSKLLKLKKDEQLTYFNLQKYMTPHFAKHTAASS
jgi:chromatin remodeling complex protein RSC6